MKYQIIGYILEENYNELLNIYKNNFKTFNLALFKRFNTGNTPSNLKTLIYEVKKANGIEDLDIYYYRESIKNQQLSINTRDAGDIPDNGDTGDVADNGETVIDVMTIANKEISLREEFPFLNDEHCPNVLKIAVADKITAYKKHQEANDMIQKHAGGEIELTQEELLSLGKIAVEAHRDNTLLYDELLYYKETGKFLAKNPLFWREKIQQEVEIMKAEELLKFKKASEMFFKRNEEELKTSTTLERKKELEEKVELRKFKNDLVEAKLLELK